MRRLVVVLKRWARAPARTTSPAEGLAGPAGAGVTDTGASPVSAHRTNSTRQKRQVRKGFERLYASELHLLVATRSVEAQLRDAECRELTAIFEEQSLELSEVLQRVADQLRGTQGPPHPLRTAAPVPAPPGSRPRFDEALVERHSRLIAQLRRLAVLLESGGEGEHLDFVRRLLGEHEQMVWGLARARDARAGRAVR